MPEDIGLPDDRHLAIRVMPGPADSNAEGDIFGGWIMSQVDIAGSVVARRRAQGRIVTVAVNSFQFKQPAFVGDLISCYAEVTRIGTTSITVRVQAFAERYRKHHEVVRLTEAELTYVAIDDQRRPRTVPKDEDA